MVAHRNSCGKFFFHLWCFVDQAKASSLSLEVGNNWKRNIIIHQKWQAHEMADIYMIFSIKCLSVNYFLWEHEPVSDSNWLMRIDCISNSVRKKCNSKYHRREIIKIESRKLCIVCCETGAIKGKASISAGGT